MLDHENPELRWVYLIGAAAGHLQAMPTDGLYRVGSSGVTLISSNPYTGQSPRCILREAIWGPQGDTGFATSMQPAYHAQWLGAERRRNFKHDANFESYLTLMGVNWRHPSRSTRQPIKLSMTRSLDEFLRK